MCTMDIACNTSVCIDQVGIILNRVSTAIATPALFRLGIIIRHVHHDLIILFPGCYPLLVYIIIYREQSYTCSSWIFCLCFCVYTDICMSYVSRTSVQNLIWALRFGDLEHNVIHLSTGEWFIHRLVNGSIIGCWLEVADHLVTFWLPDNWLPGHWFVIW